MKKTDSLTVLAGLLLTGPFASLLAAVGPDAFGYVATDQTAYSYADISNTGVSVLSGADDATATLTLPFPFRFYGASFSILCASSNGLISFGGCNQDFNNIDLTSQVPLGDLPTIAPFWDDLSFSPQGAGSVVYQTLGSPGSRRFVLQWNNASALNSGSPFNFQVVLYEATNVILFQYRSLDAGPPAAILGAGATVGIRATGGQSNGRRLQWSLNAPVLKNSLAISFTPPGNTAPPVDVTSSVKVSTSGLVYNRLTKTYSGTITVLNTSNSGLARPLNALVNGLASGVTLLNSAGVYNGVPYLIAPGSGTLGPGQSVDIPVSFTNPSNAVIRFTVLVLSGSI